jgi:hypothetical protein
MDDGLDDREGLSALIAITARELPAPKPKPPKTTAKPKAVKK